MARDFLQRRLGFDWSLLVCAGTLLAIGLTAIYGIGIAQQPIVLFPFYKQIAAILLGVSAALVLGFNDYRQWRNVSTLLYLAGALLLIGVLIFGTTVNGTRGWFRFGPISFQPIEIAKLTLTVHLASVLSQVNQRRLSWHICGRTGLISAVYIVLVLFQPDFGSALVLAAIWAALLLFRGLPKHAILISAIVGIVISAITWLAILKPYQQERLKVFVQPERDAQGSGYNVIQAHIAIGSGGWIGKGVGEGSQARLRFLPEANTDFIFAVLGEEWGLLGLLVVIGLFGVMFWRIMTIAAGTNDHFGTLLVVGLGTYLLLHSLVNMGMNLGLAPVTGIPLPFVSAAASFTVAGLMSLGLISSVAIHAYRYHETVLDTTT